LFGLAAGAVAYVAYRRRATLLAMIRPQETTALPAGGTAPVVRGNTAVQSTNTTAGSGVASWQSGPAGIMDQIRRYVESARAQLDVAIAEGQVAAAQTRQELEARFAAAKNDPGSARSAFS
jgi:hypothetical protein